MKKLEIIFLAIVAFLIIVLFSMGCASRRTPPDLYDRLGIIRDCPTVECARLQARLMQLDMEEKEDRTPMPKAKAKK